jgi:Fe-S-cluster containining protein
VLRSVEGPLSTELYLTSAKENADTGSRHPFGFSALRYPLGMSIARRLPVADQKLVQIVDAAFADAAQRSGKWLLCRPGCAQCCMGVFEINQLDALRLKQGLAELKKKDPRRAGRVRQRAREAVKKLASSFPGDARTGLLREDPEAQAAFEDFANDEPCPALDRESGTCDLYEYRPLTCRVFGPPIRSEGGLGVCELCFQGATPKQVAACEMQVDPEGLEEKLLREIRDDSKTIVAYCLK